MFITRRRVRGPLAVGAAAVFLTLTGASAAHAEPVPLQPIPEDAIIMTDEPRGDEVMTPLGTSCGGVLNPCGIVYNRTGSTLELSRDASSHFYCGAIGPYRNLPSGQNSNAYGSPRWPDVDCVRSKTKWIVTNGRVYPPGEWIRIWTSKWFYGA